MGKLKMKIKRKCEHCDNICKVDFRWLGESQLDKLDLHRTVCPECIDKLHKFMDFNDEE